MAIPLRPMALASAGAKTGACLRMTTRTIAVIPARMASSRFPGKPLACIHGRPMIEHVYRGTVRCSLLADVVVATCDAEIADAAATFGARVVLTGRHHTRASERVAEAVVDDSAEVVVMVQGDEPMVQPAMIEQAAAPLLADRSISCVNLMAQIATREELESPGTIKVVVDSAGRALYFSRSPIPSLAQQPWEKGAWFKQVCIIAFRRSALDAFVRLRPSRLEQAESIDMLRYLEHGIPVQMVATDVATHAVDHVHDLAVIEMLMSAAAARNGECASE